MINTTAPVIHDCQCTLGGEPPESHGFYRAFLWHKWSFLANVCLVPIEMPFEETASLMGYSEPFHGHMVGRDEETPCLFPVRPNRVEALIDSFWENLRQGGRDELQNR